MPNDIISELRRLQSDVKDGFGFHGKHNLKEMLFENCGKLLDVIEAAEAAINDGMWLHDKYLVPSLDGNSREKLATALAALKAVE